MKTLKTIIVYVSISHNNTEKIAKALAEALSADLKRANQINPSNLFDYDLLGFGSGIYNGKHDKSLINLVEALPQIDKKAFIFSTAGYVTEDRVRKYHEPLRRALQSRGFRLVGEFNCQGLDTAGLGRLMPINKGRPNDEDLKKAVDFALNIKGQVF